jgi:hypothetical protein
MSANITGLVWVRSRLAQGGHLRRSLRTSLAVGGEPLDVLSRGGEQGFGVQEASRLHEAYRRDDKRCKEKPLRKRSTKSRIARKGKQRAAIDELGRHRGGGSWSAHTTGYGFLEVSQAHDWLLSGGTRYPREAFVQLGCWLICLNYLK